MQERTRQANRRTHDANENQTPGWLFGCERFNRSHARQHLLTMNYRHKLFFCGALFCVFASSAQLAVTVSSPKIVGQKVVVKLAMKNGLVQKIDSARAVCFLLDDQGTMIGQSTKWVIGQNKMGLKPGATNTFNFVISSPQPFTSTNLIAKLSFTKVVLDSGKLADIKSSVVITGTSK